MNNGTLLDGGALILAVVALVGIVVIAIRNSNLNGNMAAMRSPNRWRLSDGALYAICGVAIALGLAIELGYLGR